ncbi:hypothetical protein ACN9MZ_14605 [Pseudoduganella sp. S-14]|uniref:hypothetical protein n=1 Tax=Pseudoduganella sp. S-14 TaxID=3404065 RepID=UPI003CFB1579
MENSPDAPKRCNLSDRLRSVVQLTVSQSRRFKELEELSGIPATHWRNFFSGKQRPTVEMIEFAARHWPEHAFWLATGISDAKHGHIDPHGPPDTAHRIDALHLERRAAGRKFKAELDRLDYITQRLQENPHFDQDEQLLRLEVLIGQLQRLREEEERTMNELEKNGD